MYCLNKDARNARKKAPWGTGRKVFHCMDLHCGGEPARVLLSGCPTVKGSTVEEKRRYFMENLDEVRLVLLQEPRGYPCQNLNILVPPCHPSADIGYIIAEQNKIYPLFSGHNTICVVTAVLEAGLLPMQEPETRLCLEAPGGLIQVRANCESGRVVEVSMEALPSFLGHKDVQINVPELGKVTLDLAFGGMWYAIVEADQVGLKLEPENGKKIAKLGEMIKVSCQDQHPVEHPTMSYPGPDILVFTGPPRPGSGASATNTVVMSNGQLDWNRPDTFTAMLDRSPCGSGTAAVMAAREARGSLKLGEEFLHDSILGTRFRGRLLRETKVGSQRAVVPEVSGRAWVTSVSDQVIEADDPLPLGYTVGDIWC